MATGSLYLSRSEYIDSRNIQDQHISREPSSIRTEFERTSRKFELMFDNFKQMSTKFDRPLTTTRSSSGARRPGYETNC